MEDLIHLLKNYLSILVPPMRLEKIPDSNLISLNFKEYVMSAELINFGFSFNEASKDIVKADLTLVRERCKEFLMELCNQIQYLLPSNIDILQKISFLTPENATAQIKRPNITSLATSFRSICEDVDATISEWNTLHRSEWQNTEQPESYWLEVARNKNALGEARFSHIAKLATSLLSLSFSNATVERAFSIANIVKNKIRNRLAISSTDAIMRVRFYLQE
ncbi:unnamed protein product [Psylliodes chrysocephalus]|uniref:HAT C-terminal dimerisation domain-containing protein n=1 Tax=Psylliodes chrysocephalus TaxID=3402493 RepID=A0A9P0CWE7_9CUCU|nr:unnamed protein product [Psylliodes chrysocephala]